MSIFAQLELLQSKGESTKDKVKRGRASVLFSADDAADIDSDSIYTMGLNGFQELCDLDARVATFEAKLFSKAAKNTNRDLQTNEYNEDLDKTLRLFLARVSPFALLKPVHKVFEYLVRQFKIHERNVDDFMGCVLPFHSTKIFSRVLAICAIEDTRWRFLLRAQQAGAFIERSVLVTRCCDDLSLVSFFCDLAQTVADGKHRCQTVVTFTTVLFIEVLQRCKRSPDILKGFFNRVLPYITTALKSHAVQDFQMAGYMLVVSLCQSGTRLTPELYSYFVSTISVYAPQDKPEPAVRCLVHIYQSAAAQNVHVPMPAKAYSKLRAMEIKLVQVLKVVIESGVNGDAFFSAFLNRLVPQVAGDTTNALRMLCTLVNELPAEKHVGQIVKQVTGLAPSFQNDEHLKKALTFVAKRYSDVFDAVMEEQLSGVEESKRKPVFDFVMKTFSSSRHRPIRTEAGEGGGGKANGDTTLFLALEHSLQSVRLNAIGALETISKSPDGNSGEAAAFVYSSVARRIGQDESPVVVKQAAKLLQAIDAPCNSESMASTVLGQLGRGIERYSSKQHIDVLQELVACLGCDFIAALPKNERGHVGMLLNFLPTIHGLNNVLENNEALPSKGPVCQNALIALQSKVYQNASFWYGRSPGTKRGKGEKQDTKPLLARITSEEDVKSFQSTLAKNIVATSTKLLKALQMFESFDLTLNGQVFVYEILSSLKGVPKLTVARCLVRMIINRGGDTKDFELEFLTEALSAFELDEGGYHGVAEHLHTSALRFSRGDLQFSDNNEIYVTAVFLFALSKEHIMKEEARACIESMMENHFGASPLEFLLLLAQPTENEGATYDDRLRCLCLSLANSFMESTKAAPGNRRPTSVDFQIVLPSLLALMRSKCKEVRALAQAILVDHFSDVSAKSKMYGSGNVLYMPEIKLNAGVLKTVAAAIEDAKSDICEEYTGIERCLQRLFYGQLGSSQEQNICQWCINVAENMLEKEPRNAMMMVLSLQKAPSSLVITYGAKLLEDLIDSLGAKDGSGKAVQNQYHIRTFQICADHFFKFSDVEEFTNDHMDAFCSILKAGVYDAPCIPLNYALSLVTPSFCQGLPSNGANKVFEIIFSILAAGPKGLRRDHVQACLKVLPFNPESIVEKIRALLPTAGGERRQKGKKRAKISKTEDLSANLYSEEWVANVTTTAEICHVKSDLETSREIASLFMDILRTFLAQKSEDADDQYTLVEYSMHMIMEAARALLENNVPSTKVQGSRTKKRKTKSQGKQHFDESDVQTIVRCIQETRSSQTRNSGLLLLAHVAKETPKAVLKSLVPVFTFMGESAVKHDDNYTFHVVQKIVQSVVNAVKEVQDEHDLTLQSLLKVFVKSLKDIHPHRRQRLIYMVVSIMKNGALATTISLLLVEASANGENADFDPIEFGIELANRFSVEEQTALVAQLTNGLTREQLLDDGSDHMEVEEDDEETASIFFPPLSTTENDVRVVRSYFKMALQYLSRHISSKGFLRRLVAKQKRGNVEQHIDDSFMNSCQDLITLMRKLSMCKKSDNETQGEGSTWDAMSADVYAVLAKINAALTTPSFLAVITALLRHDALLIRRNALSLLAEKIEDEQDSFDESEELAFLDMLEDIPQYLQEKSKFEVQDIQISIYALDILVGAFGEKHPQSFKPFSALLGNMLGTKVCKRTAGLRSGVQLSLAKMCTVFGVSMLPILTPLMNSLLDSIEPFTGLSGPEIAGLTDARRDTLEISLKALNKVVQTLPKFISPYISKTLSFLLTRQESGVEVMAGLSECCGELVDSIATSIEPRILLPEFYNVFPLLKLPVNECRFFDMLALHVNTMSKPQIKQFHLQVFKLYLQAFASHDLLGAEESVAYRESLLSSFVNLVLKLNEKRTRPLFFKTKEFVHEGPAENNESIMRSRIVLLFHMCEKLADHLKSIFIPFLSYVFEMAMDELRSFETIMKRKSVKKTREEVEWHVQSLKYVLSTLTKCFLYDAAASSVQVEGHEKFITQARFNASVDGLVGLLSCYEIDKKRNEGDYSMLMSEHVTPCIANFALAAGNDELWKGIHHRVCLKTREEKSIVRYHSLRTIKVCFEEVGEEYLIMLPETISFLAELLEDQNEDVEQLARQVKAELESLSGGESLDNYLFG